jgi:hypothetical protein
VKRSASLPKHFEGNMLRVLSACVLLYFISHFKLRLNIKNEKYNVTLLKPPLFLCVRLMDAEISRLNAVMFQSVFCIET